MKNIEYASLIIQLKNEDLALRNKLLKEKKLSQGYNPEMASLHNKNALILDEIIEKIGYPSVLKIGKEASDAAWLIIQHAIGQPNFMKNCKNMLSLVPNKSSQEELNLAYLIDRIAVFEGKEQLYGTQFDWDEDGKMSPQPYDDKEKVTQRRKLLGLNTLEEQTAKMRRQIKDEGQISPIDNLKKQQDYDQWRRKVGWIK